LERGIPVLYDIAPSLLNYLRATFAPNSEVTFDDRFEAIQSARVLVLDDLGAESSTLISLSHSPGQLRSRLSDSTLGQSLVNAAPDYRSAEGKKAYQAARCTE